MKKIMRLFPLKKSVMLLSFLLTLTLLPMSFAGVVIGQELSFPLDDAQKILRNEKECDLDRRELELRKQQDVLKDQRIANLEKELALIKQELVLKDKMGEIKDMEILATRRALADMEKVVDRSLKLAETAKPKNTWETYGPLAIIAIIVVTIASVL